MQLPRRKLQHNTDRPLLLVHLLNPPHHPPRLLLIILSDHPPLTGHLHIVQHPQTHNLISIVDQLAQHPLQRIVAVIILVQADHERAAALAVRVAPVLDVQRERDGVLLRGLAGNEVVEGDVRFEATVSRGRGHGYGQRHGL
jgi:hypothetical protein